MLSISAAMIGVTPARSHAWRSRLRMEGEVFVGKMIQR